MPSQSDQRSDRSTRMGFLIACSVVSLLIIAWNWRDLRRWRELSGMQQGLIRSAVVGSVVVILVTVLALFGLLDVVP